MKEVIIIGTGGHSTSIRDSLNEINGIKLYGYIDKFKKIDNKYIIANDINDSNYNELSKYYFIIAVGNNKIRDEWYKKIVKFNLKLINIIDKTANLSKTLLIGNGNFIGRNVTITSNVQIGNNCIINTGSIIEHGCNIMNSVNISPGSVICGDVCINDLSWIGANSTIIGQLNIGKNVTIGAGTIIRNDINDNEVWVGNPSRFLKMNE